MVRGLRVGRCHFPRSAGRNDLPDFDVAATPFPDGTRTVLTRLGHLLPRCAPHPQPLSPEYRGEGSKQTAPAAAGDTILPHEPTLIHVALGPRSYEIAIGAGNLPTLGRFITERSRVTPRGRDHGHACSATVR